MARNDQNIATVRRVFEAVYPYDGQILGAEQVKRLGTVPSSLVGRGWAVPVPTQAGNWTYNRYLIQFPSGFSIEEYLKQWKENIIKSAKSASFWKDDNRLMYRRGRETNNFYYLLKWDAATEAWTIVDKCFAYAFQGACKAWKIDSKTAQSSTDNRIVDYKDLKEYGL